MTTRKMTAYALILLILLTLWPVCVQIDAFAGSNAEVVFEEEEYSFLDGNTVTVKLYLKADSVIGLYNVILSYDTSRLEYVKGAEAADGDRITLSGTGFSKTVKYVLTFRTVSGGDAGIAVKRAVIQSSQDDGGQNFNITTLGKAKITINGEDITDLPGYFESEISQDIFYLPDIDIPLIGRVSDVSGEEKYIVDLSTYTVDIIDMEKTEGVLNGLSVVFLTDQAHYLKILYLMDKEGNLSLYVYSETSGLLYPCHESTTENILFYCSPYALNNYTGKMSWDTMVNDNLVVVLTSDHIAELAGVSENYELVLLNELKKNSRSLTRSPEKLLALIIVILMFLAAVMAVAALISLKRFNRLKRLKLTKKDGETKKIVPDAGSSSKVKASSAANAEIEAEEFFSPRIITERPGEKPVVAVNHITMDFKVSTSNASGIKEFLIQMLKRQIKFRHLLALDNVSFDIYKGEVTGIIGTNGSGKSTLLKIISGALTPTDGNVDVDKKKIQLLTLGTGFDLELSARENVFLNGSLIGYSEEFLNKHYDEIVKFAELEGFMEEKVKNFSSGMVSRLGFAIATTGQAAEILILDEVLSVGDEFFRKKSLARVKEMIHGGSTVLMVSHSIGTILDNCSKVVWIEKGKLQMVGDPKIVCRAYQKQHAE